MSAPGGKSRGGAAKVKQGPIFRVKPGGAPRVTSGPSAQTLNNLFDLFAAVATRFPERTAVEVQRPASVDAFRYDALQGMALAAAARLFAHGVRRGDRVAILAENDAHWCAAFLGILRIGATAVPLDTSYKPKQIATLLADSGAKALL